jgi:hypothetical protein
VTRAGIALRGDGGLTVRTGALPRIVGGVPVSIRELALTLDRPGFVVNPTDCAALNVHATFSSADGATATADAPYQATSCELLPFAPRISATVGAVGKTRRNAKPPVTTVLTTPPGHAVIRRAVVKLPSAVTVDLAALRTLCIGADLASGNCPEGSKVGTAEARSPLLPVPLTGDVVLAKTDPAALPGLTVLLRSPVALRLDGTFDLGSQSSTFDNIPDVPLSRFELRFLPNRVLKLFRDLCTSARVTVEAQFTGHNGKTASDRENVQRIGCAPALRATLKLGHLGVRHPSLALTVRPGKGGAPLQRLQFRLPGSLRAHPRAGDRAGRADGRRIKGLRLSRAGVVTVTLGRSGARKITLRLGRGAFTPTRALMRRLRKHPRLTFTLAATDRGHNRAERTLKVRARR